MKAYKKTLCSFAAVAVAAGVIASFAVARPANQPARIANGAAADVAPGTIGGIGLQASAGPVCESTGFEAVEGACGWELGWLCGSTFTNCLGPHPDNCDPSPIVAQDCCITNPNPLNGWYVSATSQQCSQPHVSDLNPATGERHMRFDPDPAGGNPPGCTGFGGACRINAFTPAAPIGLPPGPVVVSWDIAMGLTPQVPPFGQDVLYFSVDDGSGSAVVARFTYYANVLVYDYGVANYVQIGALTGDGVYDSFVADMNPCTGDANYYLNGNLVYTGDAAAGPSNVSRGIFNANNIVVPMANDHHDIDNYSVVRAGACPQTCGDGVIEGTEQCEPDGGAGEACCPGLCVAAGDPGECTCTRPFPFAACPNGRPLSNGSNGPFLTDGGLFTYTADTPFTSVNTCGSDYDTEILWNIFNSCSQFTDYNDECTDSDFGGGQNIGDPFAPCYTPGGFPGGSCMCVPTTPGNTYVFLVDAWSAGGFTLTTPLCSNTVVNLDKKVTCEAGPISGSCCDQLTGVCAEDATLDTCDGDFQVFTDNKTCALSPPCEPITGACCNSSPGLGGACSETIQADCQGAQLTWTPGVTCGDVECNEAMGACCDGLIGSCNQTLQAQCGCSHCSWTKGASCSTVQCVPATGACCDTGTADPTVSICTTTIMADCNCEKCSWTKGATCEEIVCDPNFIPIPTVSEWGLVIMALLLLVGGKVYFGRRQTAIA